MISNADAMKMVEEKMARESAPAQQESSEEKITEQPTPDPKQDDKPEEKPEKKPDDDKPDDKVTEDDKPEDKPEENEKDEKRPPKQKYSHEERIAHRFAQEKQKRREQREKYTARIKELEEQLEKYKGLKLEDFEGKTDDYVDWRLKERDMQNEVKVTKERMEADEQEAMRQETERRVALSFKSEEERDEYDELIRNNGPKFYEALQEVDPNGVVLDYLNSVEKYPIVLKKLMTDMDALRHVFRDKDPVILRYNLHQFTKELLEGKKEAPAVETKTKADKAEPKTDTQPKAKIPVLGKQTGTSGAPTEPVHDRAYWNDYLRKHPLG